jgi:hypothetical protein
MQPQASPVVKIALALPVAIWQLSCMKPVGHGVAMVVAVACVALTGTVIWLSVMNTRLQERVQRQQEALNRGVLSAQGREISANVLRTMGGVAATNAAMREVLRKHGYTVDGPTSAAPTAAEAAIPAAAPGTWQPVAVRP